MTLRVVGDVHGQIDADDLLVRNARPYLEIISEVADSIQVGDMGDRETYEQLTSKVDPSRHRFFPGNHDHYADLPSHSLGDFGSIRHGAVDLFFVRGAASTDKTKLVRLGRELGKTLWFEQEELTEDQMGLAEEQYLQTRPKIVLTHDAPTDIARFAWTNAKRLSPPNPEVAFRPSRTSDFLSSLLERHRPRLWLFGHYHRDWKYRENDTLFLCLGVLSYVDIDSSGNLV